LLVKYARPSYIILTPQSGADFARFAREQSADESEPRGRDVGWIAPGRLLDALADVVTSLPANSRRVQCTPPPAYGWHIIKLFEKLAAPAPPKGRYRLTFTSKTPQNTASRPS